MRTSMQHTPRGLDVARGKQSTRIHALPRLRGATSARALRIQSYFDTLGWDTRSISKKETLDKLGLSDV
ncbi:hypothetical protein E4H04_01830 [Candidatus Bathyarchaeota archaeon]|nr:MAG: hypothetical protein E4H04_01830 [Candidatus Bathyarchaeota archaeon]